MKLLQTKPFGSAEDAHISAGSSTHHSSWQQWNPGWDSPQTQAEPVFHTEAACSCRPACLLEIMTEKPFLCAVPWPRIPLSRIRHVSVWLEMTNRLEKRKRSLGPHPPTSPPQICLLRLSKPPKYQSPLLQGVPRPEPLKFSVCFSLLVFAPAG